MYLFMRKKIVYLLAKKQTNDGPTVPAGPIYEEVLPKEEIKLNSNQAYGPVGLWTVSLIMWLKVAITVH